MKLTIDVDCTPEEARRFLGLPDLSPLQEAYVERMKKAAGEAMSPEYVAEMIKKWGPMSEAGIGMWKAGVEQMGSGKKK